MLVALHLRLGSEGSTGILHKVEDKIPQISRHRAEDMLEVTVQTSKILLVQGLLFGDLHILIQEHLLPLPLQNGNCVRSFHIRRKVETMFQIHDVDVVSSPDLQGGQIRFDFDDLRQHPVRMRRDVRCSKAVRLYL